MRADVLPSSLRAALAALCAASAALLLLPAHALAAPGGGGDQLVARTLDFVTLRYDFLAYTVGGTTLVGLTCGLLGVFMVLRRMSLMGDALSHAALPGVGLAFLIVQSKSLVPILIGATGTALLAALLIGYITRNSRTRPDAALGLVLSTFFGFGVVLMSYIQHSPSGAQSGLSHFMFGNAAAIRPDEVVFLGGLFVVCAALVALFYRPLQVLAFDPTFARSIGLPTRGLHYGLMVLVSVAIVASMQSVGVILVAAMLIIPAATARLLTDRFHRMLLIAPTLGAVSGILGAWLSYLFDGFSSGPSMVLVAALMYSVAFFVAPQHGVLPRMWRERARRARTQAPQASPPPTTPPRTATTHP